MTIVDTSAIIALLDTSERNHTAVLECWGQQFSLPVTLFAEIDYMISTKLGSHIARRFFRGIARGDLEILEFTATDLQRANDIMNRYPNVPLGLADSSIIALAEKHEPAAILTLDRRHFSIVKPLLKQGYFTLLPLQVF